MAGLKFEIVIFEQHCARLSIIMSWSGARWH